MRGRKSRDRVLNDLRKAESTAYSIIHLIKEYQLIVANENNHSRLDVKVQKDSIKQQLIVLSSYLKDT